MIKLVDDLGPREISVEELESYQVAVVTHHWESTMVGQLVMRAHNALVSISNAVTWPEFYDCGPCGIRLNNPQSFRVRVLPPGAKLEVV